MQPRAHSLPVLILAATLSSGCTASPAIDGGEDTEEECTDGIDGDADGIADCGDPGCAPWCGSMGGDDAGRPPPRDGGGGFHECVGTPYEAEEAFAPVDIVWVVDTSGSMSNEAERVQENMQAFAEAIGGVGIDWHVVMISTQSYVNVPASLADDPRYRLIDRPVSSNEPLRALLAEYDNYADFLRRSATLHFVAVTDDESDLPWDQFHNDMRRTLGHGYVFHAICSERVDGGGGLSDGACTTDGSGFPPDGAAAAGDEYIRLTTETGGAWFSICTPASEWTDLFDRLTAAIAVPRVIPCEYAIPEPPPETELDFGKVNVRFTTGTGIEVPYRYAQTSDGVDCTNGGWYYDDPGAPSRIILCPLSCAMVGGDIEGRVDVELGCQTRPLF